MSKKIDDGGPAYPVEVGGGPYPNEHQVSPSTSLWYGMSRRQRLAEKAMAAILSAGSTDGEEVEPFVWADGRKLQWNHPDHPKQIARLSYEMADAMIEAEKEKPDG